MPGANARAMEKARTLPADVIVHPCIVVTRKSFEKVIEQIESATPTPALRDLMRDGD